MAGAIMTSFSAGDANATALMEHANKTVIGQGSLSLTHMTDTTVPAIAAGSWIEINGAIAKFDTETAISTTDPVTSATVADGTVYIILIPSGSVVNASFTATAPTWSDSKQGYYGTTTWANDRYCGQVGKSGTSYSGKQSFTNAVNLSQNSTFLRVGRSVYQSINANTDTTIDFDDISFDRLSEFNLSSNSYTVSIAGYYRISVTARFGYVSGSNWAKIYTYVGATQVAEYTTADPSNSSVVVTGSQIIYLASSSVLTFKAHSLLAAQVSGMSTTDKGIVTIERVA